MSSLIDWNIDQERDAAATGVDPYEPITEEDEGFPGWVGAVVVILMCNCNSDLSSAAGSGEGSCNSKKNSLHIQYETTRAWIRILLFHLQ